MRNGISWYFSDDLLFRPSEAGSASFQAFFTVGLPGSPRKPEAGLAGAESSI